MVVQIPTYPILLFAPAIQNDLRQASCENPVYFTTINKTNPIILIIDVA
jgi:hypothetical protein